MLCTMILKRCTKNTIHQHFHFTKLPQTKTIHTQTIISTHLKNCTNITSLQSLQAIMIKTNTIQDCYLMNKFISACSSLNQINYAYLAFTHMTFPNVFVYNALIRGLVHMGSSLKALEVYVKMLRENICPSSYTFSSLIKGCGRLNWLKFGEGLHCQVTKNGLDSNLFVLTALVDFYGNLGVVVGARKLFEEMPERDGFALITMVSVFSRNGDMRSARRLFDEMPERSVNVTAWNCMIDGYARVGDVEAAACLFERMPSKDLVSWTSMINCYSQNKRYKDALAVFDEMMGNGICPDEMMLTTVISCCAHVGALNLGRDVHFYVVREGFLLDVYIGSALIDMYAKCGRLDRSFILFLNLRQRNLFCWNAIIEGLAAHGHGKSALTMFYQMLKDDDIKPNGVTFVSVLSACAHAGLVTEGRKIFQSMIDDFHIYPQIEHYGCMVDLLCRAKLLEEALELIKSMEFKPNAIIWGAFLSGCKFRKNLHMAEIAVSKLRELEPENCGYYFQLVNLYAEANRWKDVVRIRLIMKELGVEKRCPGSSWIEMENKLHQFVAADQTHPSSNEIHILLDELYGKLASPHSLSEFEDIV